MTSIVRQSVTIGKVSWSLLRLFKWNIAKCLLYSLYLQALAMQCHHNPTDRCRHFATGKLLRRHFLFHSTCAGTLLTSLHLLCVCRIVRFMNSSDRHRKPTSWTTLFSPCSVPPKRPMPLSRWPVMWSAETAENQWLLVRPVRA